MGSIRRRQFLVAAGAALAAPLVRAQPRRLGALGGTITSQLRSEFWKPFISALRERGWREGDNLIIEARSTGGDSQRARQLAQELLADGVEVVLAINTATAVAVKQVSDRIPVVSWCGYPVEAGLAASLSRPGGNVTGVANYAGTDIWGKFVELLREVRPGSHELGVLWDYAPPAFPDGPIALSVIEEAARQMGMRSRVWMVRSERDLGAALAEIERSPVEALILTNGGGVHHQPKTTARIREVVIRRRLPSITDVASTVFSEGASLLAYSPNVPELLVRLADFVDRILRGAKPGELPFERPSRFDLAINLRTARAMGLSVPPALLMRADRVLE